MKRDAVKWWQLLLLIPVDAVPCILWFTTGHPTIYVSRIPYHFIVIAIAGLCIKYLGNLSFGKLDKAIFFAGAATWHIFLFQQLYFWLVELLDWQFGNTYVSFPICLTGGILFYTAQLLITKLIKRTGRADL